MLKIHELQEARAAAVAEMRALNDKAETEKRDLTAEENEFYTRAMADLDATKSQIDEMVAAERRDVADGDRVARHNVAEAGPEATEAHTEAGRVGRRRHP